MYVIFKIIISSFEDCVWEWDVLGNSYGSVSGWYIGGWWSWGVFFVGGFESILVGGF